MPLTTWDELITALGDPGPGALTDPQVPSTPVAPTPQVTTAPPKPPTEANRYESAIDQLNGGRLRTLEHQQRQATELDPERAARTLRIANGLGLPYEVVDRDYERLNRSYDFGQLPLKDLAEQAPETAKLAASSVPTAAAVKDDLQNLSFLEWFMKGPKRAWTQGLAQNTYGPLRWKEITQGAGSLSPAERARMVAAKADMQKSAMLGATAESWYDLPHFARGAITGTLSNLPNWWFGLQNGLGKGVFLGTGFGTLTAIAGQAGPQVLTPEEVITVPAAFGAGFMVGTTSGAVEYTAALEGAFAMDEFEAFTDAAGNPVRVDTDVARLAAITTGYLNGFLEVSQAGIALKYASQPLRNWLITKGVRQGIKEALVQPTVRAAMGRVAKDYLVTLNEESLVEAAQRAVTIMAGEATKVGSGQSAATRTAGDILTDIGAEYGGALQSFALMIGPGLATNVLAEARTISAARYNKDFFNVLGEAVGASKTYTRLPGAMRAFIDHVVGEDGPIRTLYQDVGPWNEYWRSKNVDPAEMATTVTGDPHAYEDAMAQGNAGQLAIPIGRYAELIAATEHNAFFATEVRMGDPIASNTREAVAFQEALDTRIAEIEEETKTPEGEAAVVARLKDQILKSGVPAPQAELYTALIGALHNRLVERSALIDLITKRHEGVTIGVGQPGDEAAVRAAFIGKAGAAETAPASGEAAPAPPGPSLPFGEAGATIAGDGTIVPAPAEGANRGTSEAVTDPGDLTGATGATSAIGGSPATGGASGAGSAGSGGELLPGAQERPETGTARVLTPRRRRTGAPIRGASAIPARYADTFVALLAGARRLGYTGSDDQLADLFLDQTQEARQIARDAAPELDDFDHGPALLRIIAKGGGFNLALEQGGGYSGELETLIESLSPRGFGKREVVIKRGKRAGQTMKLSDKFRQQMGFGRAGELKGFGRLVSRDSGMSVDNMYEHVQQSPEFANAYETMGEFFANVMDAVMVELGVSAPGIEVRALDERNILDQLLRVQPDTAWWSDGGLDNATGLSSSEAPIDNLLANEGIQDGELGGPEVGDVSFDPREFQQTDPDAPFVQLAQKVAAALSPAVLPKDIAYVGGVIPAGTPVVYTKEQRAEAFGKWGLANGVSIASGPLSAHPIGLYVDDDNNGAIMAVALPPGVELLGTGELQPSLPGLAGVRGTENLQPALGSVNDTFELTAPPSAPPVQRDLFQLQPNAESRAFLKRLEDLSTDEGLGVTFDEEGNSSLPNGDPAIMCTALARRIIELVGRGEVIGWVEGTNPTSKVAGPERGARVARGQGHDFALIDDRYLVDPWAKTVEATMDRAAFDLTDPRDRVIVLENYGDPKTWLKLVTRKDGSTEWRLSVPTLLQPPSPRTLYQDDYLGITNAQVQTWAQSLQRAFGPDLVTFNVGLTNRGTLTLDQLTIRQGVQRTGLGSAVMRALIDYADRHALTIELQLAEKGEQGVTSEARLSRFYRRFGFVLNLGQRKRFDLSLYTAMYREPTLKATASGLERAPKIRTATMADLAARGYDVTRVFFHQTSLAARESIYNQGFDIDRPTARMYDPEVADGVFLQPTPQDLQIGARDPEQRVQVPVFFRKGVVKFFLNRQSVQVYALRNPTYVRLFDEKARLDQDYQRRFDAADDAAHGDNFETAMANMEAIIVEWKQASAAVSAKMRAELTTQLRDEGFDTVRIEKDQGSFGRVVETWIAIAGDQIARADEGMLARTEQAQRIFSDVETRVLFQREKGKVYNNPFGVGDPAQNFYLKLIRGVEAAERKTGTGADWGAYLRNVPQSKAETEFFGPALDLLDKAGTFTRDEIIAYLGAHRPLINVVRYGEPTDARSAREAVEDLAKELYEEYYATRLRDIESEADDREFLDDVPGVSVEEDTDTEEWVVKVDGREEDRYATEREAEERMYAITDEAVDDVRREWIREMTREIDEDELREQAEEQARERLEDDDNTVEVQYEQYSEKGYVSGSYREVFVTLPDFAHAASFSNWRDGHDSYSKVINPIVRVRYDERRRRRADGTTERIFFVEELQPPSQEEQKKMPPVLLANWRELGMKWVFSEAMRGRFDAVAWTNGDMQKARYSLEKVVSQIRWLPALPSDDLRVSPERAGQKLLRERFNIKIENGYTVPTMEAGAKWHYPAHDEELGEQLLPLAADTRGGSPGLDVAGRMGIVQKGSISPSPMFDVLIDGKVRTLNRGENRSHIEETIDGRPLGDLIGRELADQILATHDQAKMLNPEDLKIGGKGLAKLYDVDFPRIVKGLPIAKQLKLKADIAELRFDHGPDYNSPYGEYESLEIVPGTYSDEVAGPNRQREFKLMMHAAPGGGPDLRLRVNVPNMVITDAYQSGGLEWPHLVGRWLGDFASISQSFGDVRDYYGATYGTRLKLTEVLEHYGDRDTGSTFEPGKEDGPIRLPRPKETKPVPYVAFPREKMAAGGFSPPIEQSFFQDEETKKRPRGVVRFNTANGIRTFDIRFLAHADPTTLLHEFAHTYFEILSDVVVELEKTPATELGREQLKLVTDYKELLRYLGASDHQLTDAQHELFARTFEGYLGQGIAPSLDLQPAFARFRAWTLSTYQTDKRLAEYVGQPIAPEVKAVFDRLLASEGAIYRAEQEGKVAPMFLTAEAAGMTPERFALYRDAIADASRIARERLDRKVLADARKQQGRAWAKRRQEIQQNVSKEISERPIYRALTAIRFGTLANGDSINGPGMAPEPLKLSRSILVARYGPEALDRLPRPYVYAIEGGADPDIVAEMFGFDSGKALLDAIETAPPLAAAINVETDRRMVAENGPEFLDATLMDKARAAVVNDQRSTIIRAEIRALHALAAQARPFERKAVEDLAAERRERDYERRWFDAEHDLALKIATGAKQSEIDRLAAAVSELKQRARSAGVRLRVGLPDEPTLEAAAVEKLARTGIRFIRPEAYWTVAARASQEAMERAGRHDFEGAIAAKIVELEHFAAYRAAEGAARDIEKRLDRVKRLQHPLTKQMLGKAGANFLEQVEAILARFDFAPLSNREAEKRELLATFVEGQRERGFAVELPDILLQEIRRLSYKSLSYGDFQDVTDGLDQILHLAREQNRIRIAGKKVELDTKVAELVAHIKTTGRARTDEEVRNQSKLSQKIGGFFAAHRKLSSLLREFDGLKDNGPWWEAIMLPLNKAADREASMQAAATAHLDALLRKHYEGAKLASLHVKAVVPAIGRSMSKLDAIVVALNWGNAGNRQRVQTYEGWTTAQVQAILDTLDVNDAAFVQEVFDFVGSYWTQIEAKMKRVLGVSAARVKAQSFTIRGVELPGGYYPIKYDPRISPMASDFIEANDAGTLAPKKGGAYIHSTTRRGHENARKQKVSAPIRYDIGVLTEHVSQVIHDLTHHEALLDVSKILSDRRVQKAIFEQHGEAVYKQFKTSIKDIAQGQQGAQNDVERALDHLRSGAAVAVMGWKVQTALMQPLGLTQSAARIGTKYVALGMYRWLRSSKNQEDTVAWVYEQSEFMRNRGRTQQREINEIRNTVGLSTGGGKLSGWMDEFLSTVTHDHVTKADIADSYFWLIQQAQVIADMPTWLGQYEKSMAEDVDMTHARAVELADQAVIDSQGSGYVKDLAAVQRGGPLLKVWTLFYSFFSATHNQLVERTKVAGQRGWKPKAIGRLAVDYLNLTILPATLGWLLTSAIRGDMPKDPRDRWLAFARENLAYLFGTTMIARELGGMLQGFDYTGPPGTRAFAAIGKAGKQLGQIILAAVHGDSVTDKFDPAFWRAINEAGGILFHYPSGQVAKTVEGITGMIESGDRPGYGALVGPGRTEQGGKK